MTSSFSWLKDIQRVQKQFGLANYASELSDIFRHQESVQLFKEITRREWVVAQAPSSSNLYSEMSRSFQVISSQNQLNDLYRLPVIDDFARLSSIYDSIAKIATLQPPLPSSSELVRMAESIHVPWVSMEDTLGSLRGLAELTVLSRGLASTTPYDERITSAVRTELGDWRNIAEFPEEIFLDSIARKAFYEGLGFNSQLTDFSRSAFDVILDEIGMRMPVIPMVIPTRSQRLQVPLGVTTRREFYSTDFSDAPPAENREAYHLIYALETRFRVFVDLIMTQKFGCGWPRHRVPEDTYKAWQAKKDQHHEKDGIDNPLIWYADFTDYLKIIVRKDNWREVFQRVFQRRESIEE